MKHIYFVLLSAILVSLLSACQKEQNEPIDNGTYNYSLSVLNDDYTEVIPIKGVKASQVASKSNLPSWVKDVYLTGEVENGNLLLGIDVKGDPTLEDRREAAITLSMSNRSTVELKLVQWPTLTDGTNAVLESTNTQFEKKWYDAREIDLVVGSGYENGIPSIKTITVALPWAHDLLPQQHLPEKTLMEMMAFKEDWSLVFNLTGGIAANCVFSIILPRRICLPQMPMTICGWPPLTIPLRNTSPPSSRYPITSLLPINTNPSPMSL